jgi:hypothetical protein
MITIDPEYKPKNVKNLEIMFLETILSAKLGRTS